MSTFIFACPHCGHPSAETVEDLVDIHSGATYRCVLCDGPVIFEALTPAEYVKRAVSGKARG